jgi:hypothetical protein
VIVRCATAPTHPGELPDALVGYALRTQEIMLLDDASSSQNPFSGDPYIVQRCARSILCLSLITVHIAKPSFAAFSDPAARFPYLLLRITDTEARN